MAQQLLHLLIDGYNVLSPVAGPSRMPDPNWLHRERMQLIQRLSVNLHDQIRPRTCVVFDAANPPPDRPHQFQLDELDIRFAVGYPEADDLLEELILQHTSPKQLAVISSDHRIQAAARRRGCTWFESQLWFDNLLEGHVQLSPRAQRAIARRAAREGGGAGQGGGASTPIKPVPESIDVEAWMREFGLED